MRVKQNDANRDFLHHRGCKQPRNLRILLVDAQKLSNRILPLCLLSPAPAKKYPIFLGFKSLLVKGGLASAGVGTWRTGNGGAFCAIGSVNPGTEGISGGRET